jgi:hypothetical protein
MSSKIISKLLSIINFCSKTRTKPKPSSTIRTEIFENNSFWGKKEVWSWGFNQQFTTGFRGGYLELEPELGRISRTGT